MCEYLIEGLFHKSIRVKKMIGFGNFKSLKAVPIRSKFQLNTNPSKMSPKIVSRLVKTAVFKLVLSYSSVFFFFFENLLHLLAFHYSAQYHSYFRKNYCIWYTQLYFLCERHGHKWNYLSSCHFLLFLQILL